LIVELFCWRCGYFFRPANIQRFDDEENLVILPFHLHSTWYSPTNTFVEYRTEPNGDFVETTINTWHQASDGNVVFEKERMVEKLINVHLPNLQRQLFIEVLEQCME